MAIFGSGVTTQFVYDQAGHLIAESNASGVVQKEYIWLDDLLVGLVDSSQGTPVLYFVHSDQLGTPQKITDTSKAACRFRTGIPSFQQFHRIPDWLTGNAAGGSAGAALTGGTRASPACGCAN